MSAKCKDNMGFDFSNMEDVVFVEERDSETMQLLGIKAVTMSTEVSGETPEQEEES